MEDIEIRQAEIRDHQSLVDFNCQMAFETEAKILNQDLITQGVLGILTNSSRGFYIVAINNFIVVGCLMVTFE